MSKKIKSFLILIVLLFAFLFITVSSYANTISKDLSDNFFRLHILANSNSTEDQNLKLKVRDNIISYMNTLTYSEISKKEAIESLSKIVEELENTQKNFM